jgi:2C-methyl-D-erythritol 2,4-cyclodiphosphate synthase
MNFPDGHSKQNSGDVQVTPSVRRRLPSIAGLLGMDFAAVNVKVKANRGLGETGAGEATAATAVALLPKKPRWTL